MTFVLGLPPQRKADKRFQCESTAIPAGPLGRTERLRTGRLAVFASYSLHQGAFLRTPPWLGCDLRTTAKAALYFLSIFPMMFYIDLGSLIIEAANAEEAYALARQMIDADPSFAEICEVSPL